MLTADVFASESGSSEQGSATTSEGNITVDEMTPAMQEQMEKRMNEARNGNGNRLRVGESQKTAQFSDGTVLYVTLIEEELLSRAAKTTKMSWMFYTENWLGSRVDAFKIDMTCSWNENGENSKISSLNGVYTRYDKSFSLFWEQSDAYVSDIYHQLPLSVYHDGGSAYYVFDALLNIILSPVVCDIDYGAY